MADEVKQPTTQQERLTALLNKLWGDKSPTGSAVRKVAKEMFPDITIPEDVTDAATAPIKAEVDSLKDQLKGALDKIAAREKADEDLRVENDLAVKLAAAQKEFGLTDAGYQKMVARMKETGNVSDASAAAAWVVSQMPKPEPANSPSWLPEASNLFGVNQRDEQFEKLHTNPQKYMDDQLREFIRDPDKYVADTFGRS